MIRGVGAPSLGLPCELGEVALHGASVWEAGDEHCIVPLVREQIMQLVLAGHVHRSVRAGGFHEEQPSPALVPCDDIRGLLPCLETDAEVVEEICASVEGVVVAANYNCPGQLVISGADAAVDAACEKAKAAGARRALRLPVGGAFHSPLMEPAKQELEKAINEAPFQTPTCPIYQNVDAKPHTDPATIKANLIAQLTAPVRWTYIVKNMLADGVTEFTELGPGTVLQGLIKKVDASANVESKSTL